MHRALEIPGDKDLSDLSYFLYSQGVPHKVTEESGNLVVWTGNAEQAELIETVYQQWCSGQLQLQQAPPRRGVDPAGALKGIPWRQMPVTVLLMLVCLVVAGVTRLGTHWETIGWLSFIPFELSGQYIYFGSFAMGMDQGQYWRVLSPIFLHFGFAHLSFNMLALYIFGSRLESRQGGLHLLAIVLFSGLLSNFAQYFWGGQEALFGGFSGVVYGLMGYCMVREKVDRTWQFGLPPMYYSVMLIWLVVGYTGVLGTIGFGNMANAAHTGGLVAGCLLGAVAGMIFRQDSARANNNEEP